MKTVNGLELDDNLRVQETIRGVWFYHLTLNGKALCKFSEKELFYKALPISHWGFKGDGNVPYKYCHTCEAIAIGNSTSN